MIQMLRKITSIKCEARKRVPCQLVPNPTLTRHTNSYTGRVVPYLKRTSVSQNRYHIIKRNPQIISFLDLLPEDCAYLEYAQGNSAKLCHLPLGGVLKGISVEGIIQD